MSEDAEAGALLEAYAAHEFHAIYEALPGIVKALAGGGGGG